MNNSIEQTIFKTQKHWISFIIPIIGLGIVLLFIAPLFTFKETFMKNIHATTEMDYQIALLSIQITLCICGCPSILLFLGSLLNLVIHLKDYVSDEFIITNQRVIITRGLIKRNHFELPLDQIESVALKKAMLSHFLNHGTITITGKGGTKEIFKDAENASILHQHISAIITPKLP